MRTFIVILSLLATSACAAKSSGPTANMVVNTSKVWQVMPAKSSVHFVSIKKGHIAEVHDISGLSGEVGANGKAVLHLALNSVETHIDKRNERMRKFLFETDKWPQAEIAATLNPADYTALNIGRRLHKTIDIHVNLHGQDRDFEVPVWVTKTSGSKVLVESDGPVLVEAEDFGLTAGVAKLQELAKLPSISPVVPVTFSIVFTQ